MRRKTDKELKAAGTYRADRHASRSKPGKTLDKVPPAPTRLNAAGKLVWRHLAGMLVGRKILQEADLTMLEILADEILLYRAAQKVLLKEGLERYLSSHNVQNSLALIQRDRSKKNITLLCAKFFMTPQDRNRIQEVRLPESDQDDDLDELSEMAGD